MAFSDTETRAKEFFEYLFKHILKQMGYRTGNLPILKEWERKLQIENGGRN